MKMVAKQNDQMSIPEPDAVRSICVDYKSLSVLNSVAYVLFPVPVFSSQGVDISTLGYKYQ